MGRTIGPMQHMFGGERILVELTKMNGTKFTLNCELIEKIEDTPDTVITLSTGKVYIVKESRQDVKNLVLLYKKEIFNKI